MADKDCSKDKYEILVRSVKRYMQHPDNWCDEMMTNIRVYMDDKGNSKNGDNGIKVMMSLALTETDEHEETIIHAAVRHKHSEIVKIVLKILRGNDKNLQKVLLGQRDCTGFVQVVRGLLHFEARCHTPLHIAVKQLKDGDDGMFDLLMNQNLLSEFIRMRMLSARDEKNRTVLEIAKKNPDIERKIKEIDDQLTSEVSSVLHYWSTIMIMTLQSFSTTTLIFTILHIPTAVARTDRISSSCLGLR